MPELERLDFTKIHRPALTPITIFLEERHGILTKWVPSLYKSEDWRAALRVAAEKSKSRADFVAQQTEDSELAEGLYIKQEEDDAVIDRFKFVRGDFLQAIEASEGHWQDRPILPNGLADDVDIFAPVLGVKGAYDESP